MGHVLTGGGGQNPARQAAIGAGLPDSVPAVTVNTVCGSCMKSIHLAAQAIRCGDAELIIAGGQENMSQASHVLPGSRTGRRMGEWTMRDSMILDGLWDAFNDYHMDCTAENVAAKYGISREAQDAFAAVSQNKAREAQQSGRFSDEVVPMDVRHPRTRETDTIADDKGPRPETTADGLGFLQPVFQADGSVTAGNASGLNDGAAAVIVCSTERARTLGLPVLYRIDAYANAAVDPAIMGIGPVPAIRRSLEKAGWSADTPELTEANEAFAAQSLAVLDEIPPASMSTAAPLPWVTPLAPPAHAYWSHCCTRCGVRTAAAVSPPFA